VFENLKAALAAAGAGFGDVVKLGYYLTDISQIGAVRGCATRTSTRATHQRAPP